MGFDVHRFQGQVDEELICPICSNVLEDPLWAPNCEHTFCSSCIHHWLDRQHTCPVDRSLLSPGDLKPVPRILRNLLARLDICCDNATHGCTTVVKIDQLVQHVEECEFNPKKPVQCEQGCGLDIPKDKAKEHNCVRELHVVILSQKSNMAELQSSIDELKIMLNEQGRELQMIKDFMRALSVTNPTARAIGDEIEENELRRWVNSLTSARVTRWGGMISTPDAMLQAIIRRSISDSGCPPSALNQLMENAHEKKWPLGLSTLETRQLNRRLYDQYICRRIPGKQAVVVMYCENQHMRDDLLLEPGLILIFAHGVE